MIVFADFNGSGSVPGSGVTPEYFPTVTVSPSEVLTIYILFVAKKSSVISTPGLIVRLNFGLPGLSQFFSTE